MPPTARQRDAVRLQAAAVLLLFLALGISLAMLSGQAGDTATRTEVRWGLLDRVHGLALERAARDAAVHRAANRLLLAASPVDAGVAREIVDGARALVRRHGAMEAYWSEAGHHLPATERPAVTNRIGRIGEAVEDLAGRAGHLAGDPADPERLEAVARATADLDGVLSETRAQLEGALRRDRNRGIEVAGRTLYLCAFLAVAALALGAAGLHRRRAP